MDDAVMRYSDLIAPDNSIDSLIDLLGKVQSEYSELAQLTKRYAANMATDMRKVNTTTKAGRDELARLTTQADMAASAIKSIEAMYAGVNDELASIRTKTSPAVNSMAALSEQIQKYQRVAMGLRDIRETYEPGIIFGVIDDSFLQGIKDVDSIMASIFKRANLVEQALIEVARTQEVLNFDAAGKAASDSLTSLRQALKDIIASYEDLEAKERGSERGQATKNNLDTLRDAVTRLEAEIEPLVNKTLELIKAQQGLDLATSDEGKQIVALKQKIAELNKEMAQRAIIAEEVSDSEKALKAQLALAQTEWSKLSEVEQNSATGQALQARIKNLKTILAEMAAKIKPAKAELTALEQATQALARAQKALEVALTDEGKAAIVARQELAALNKETRLQNAEATAEKGSYDQLKAQLQQAVISYRALSETERDTTAVGQALADQITNLRAQLKALDDRTKAATASMSQDQLETRQAADVTEKLAKAKAKLVVTQSAEYEELIKTNIAQREANREAKLRAQLAESEVGSYNNMAAQYELNKIKLKQLALANRELTEDEKKLVAETYTLRNEMKKFQEMTGVHTLSVGEYGKVWDSFGYSIQQIVREMPAAAMGINNLFIAVSNNIPIFIDELMKLRKENAALIAQNKQDEVVSIGKRIASSLFSWQTALMSLLTVLTMFGDDITKWIGDLFRGEAAVISMKKAIRNLNKELENSNDSYGDNRASFKKLQNQWSELTTEVEKTEWIKNHEEAFKDLGLAIEDVNSAERILVQEADAVEETFRRRAEAAAATTLATKEYEKALVASARAEQTRAEKAEKAAKRYKKRTGKSTVTEYRQNEPGEYAPVTMNAYDYFYEAYGKDSTRDRKIKRFRSEAKAAEEAAEQFLKLGAAYDDLQDKDEGPGGSEGRDLTDRIYRARLEARKKYEKSQTALIKDEYDRRERELRDAAEAEIEALKETRRKAIEWRDDPENSYKDLTEDEQKAIQEILEKSSGNIIAIQEKLNEDLRLLAIDKRISTLKIQEETNSLLLQAVKKGSIEEYNLRRESIERQLEIALEENKKLAGTGLQQDEEVIRAAYSQQITDLNNEELNSYIEVGIERTKMRVAAAKEGSEEELRLQTLLIRQEADLALERNKQLAEDLQMDEDAIKASYARREKLLEGEYKLNAFKQGQSATRARYIADDKAGNIGIKSKQLNDYYLGIFDLEQEIALLEKQIEMAGKGFLEWSPEQIAEAEANVKKLNKDLEETKDIWNLIGEKGIGGGILTQLGFDDDQIDALQNATNIVIDQINAIMAAEVEAAEKAVELAQERVDAFQSAYDAEIEARNNGYANNVATAKKELEQEKKNQREKQKILEQAQKNQEAINSVTQASSLLTASAQLWSSFSGLGPWGVAGALAAIVTMWTSFAVAKVKAKQVAETYGDGGLEFLEGGSHASGHDIDLGTTNSRGRRMRAEGGEAMAIINKKNTRKYKAILPDIIDSLNSGNFEEKYLSSLNASGLAISVNNATVDISRIEGDVADIKKQNETKYYAADGYLVMQHKNVKRIIKN